MNKAAISASLSLALAVLVPVAGCKSHSNGATDTAPAAAPSVAEFNSAKFQNADVPQPVQSAFQRDYPKASIDTIHLRTTSAGLGFYEIRFIQNGAGGVASYYSSGAKVK